MTTDTIFDSESMPTPRRLDSRVRVALIAAVLFGLFPGLPFSLAAAPYLPESAADLTMLLPPPPVAGSQAQHDDVETVIAVQSQASPARRQQAIADNQASVTQLAGALLGPAFTAQRAPKTFALLHRVAGEVGRRIPPAKDFWRRPRPYVVDPRVKLLVERADNPAYPSGHTTFAYALALTLAAMLPEKREALFARAADYGQSRIIVGVHYLTDIDAGRTAGTVIAALLLATPPFDADLRDATAELRQALGVTAAAQ